jgi:hypothetical protein
MLTESIPSTTLENCCREDKLIEPEFNGLGFDPWNTIYKGKEIGHLFVVGGATRYRSRLRVLSSLEKPGENDSDLVSR